MSKMAAVVKPREDGTTKLRSIIDMLRSHVNENVRFHERIVLLKIVDMVRDQRRWRRGPNDPGLGGRLSHNGGASGGGTPSDRERVRRPVRGVRDGPVRGRRLPRSVEAGRCLFKACQDRRCSVLAKHTYRSMCTVLRGAPAQSQQQGVLKNTSVCLQVGGRLVHRYARPPSSCVAKDPEATSSCRVHFEASDRVKQRWLGTFTSQGQETHRTGTGYPGAHRALLAKNGRTVLRTQKRLLVVCVSTRQVGIHHHRTLPTY